MLPLLGSPYNSAGRNIIANDSSDGMSITQNGSGYVLEATGSSGLVMRLYNNEIDLHYQTFILSNPRTTPNYGLFNLGTGPWDGSSAGHFTGDVGGQLIAANFSPTLASLIRFQQQGVDIFGVYNANVRMRLFGGVADAGGPSGTWAAPIGQFDIVNNYTGGGGTIRFRLFAGQSTDVLQWQTSGGGLLGGIEAGGTIYTTAGLAAARRTVTAADQATINDYSIWCNATTAAFTETLPAANTCRNGQMIAVTKIDGSANAVTVAAKGTDTVNGAASISLGALDSTAILITDGVGEWWEIG